MGQSGPAWGPGAARNDRIDRYPLVNQQFANLNMAIEIVDLPIKTWRCSIVMLVYLRVSEAIV